MAGLIDTGFPAGDHEVTWHGEDYGTGLYFYVMQELEVSISGKKALLK